jgi:hypothetical protein
MAHHVNYSFVAHRTEDTECLSAENANDAGTYQETWPKHEAAAFIWLWCIRE